MPQKLRKTVNWWDGQSWPPKRDQMHPGTKKYWNEYTGSWTSKKSKRRVQPKGTVVIYDFYYYPSKRIKEDFGNKTYEKVAMFLTKQYQRQMQGYSAHEWEFVYWDSRRLELFLGYKWREIIKVLEDSKYIKVDREPSRYNKKKHCLYVQLDNKFINDREGIYKRSFIKDISYQNSIKKYYKSISRDLSGVMSSIAKTLDSAVLQIGDIGSILERIWEQKVAYWRASLSNEFMPIRERNEFQKRLNEPQKIKERYLSVLRAYYLNVLDIQQIGDRDQRRELYNIKESSFGGRISHAYSNMPREYRKFLRIEGEKVIEVDIKASQPTFLFVLFNKWYRSKSRESANTPQLYTDVFTALSGTKMDIYKYMVLKLKGIKFLSDPASREEMKALFYRLVFGDPKYKVGKNDKKELVVNVFGHEFYDFIVDLSKVDITVKAVDKNHKNLSYLLQKEEADFLFKVMRELDKKKIPFMPLYDSLIVKENDRSKVFIAFESTVSKMGLEGIIRIK